MKDVYAEVTAKIITLMETHGANWTKPWLGTAGSSSMPTSISSGNQYTGINTVLLWAAGRTDSRWGTYKAWSEKGCQVRKGETATHIIFFKSLDIKEKQADGSQTDKTIPLLKSFAVFCADQVDGMPVLEQAQPETAEQADARVALALDFVARAGANIEVLKGSARAYYSSTVDKIVVPSSGDFVGTATSSAIESFCGVVLHELVHWTGHTKRLARTFGASHGDADYAKEELVAELGATFLCADLGISTEPRADHAQYLASWLQVLKDDKKAIIRAASQASKAAGYLQGLQVAEPVAVAA
jgi:antirestriction protein ArdC